MSSCYRNAEVNVNRAAIRVLSFAPTEHAQITKIDGAGQANVWVRVGNVRQPDEVELPLSRCLVLTLSRLRTMRPHRAGRRSHGLNTVLELLSFSRNENPALDLWEGHLIDFVLRVLFLDQRNKILV